MSAILPPAAPPASSPSSSLSSSHLISVVSHEVQLYFQNPRFDSSHDFVHVCRVVDLAKYILQAEQRSENAPPQGYDETVIILAALLHDVGDHKYQTTDDIVTAQSLLLKHGASPELADKIQSIVSAVSYTSEIKDPRKVADMINKLPELAVVQDADRLDAIGAIGIGRCFAFGGARNRSLDDTVGHFEVKLLKLEAMMKTQTGRSMAAERTEKLKVFMDWWKDETSLSAEQGLR